MTKGQSVWLNGDHARYLFAVMRLGVGDVFAAFNGRDGVWRAEITQASRKGGEAVLREAIGAQQRLPDLWLIFAPIKKARTDFIVEKAAELGVARILPVITALTQSGRVNRARLQAHAIEAVEQCGGCAVPEIFEAQPLAAVLEAWEADRGLWFCDEALAGEAGDPGGVGGGQKGAVLIGPEGGFNAAERALLSRVGPACRVRLGPRILRADTAAVAALTLWQSQLGDWQNG